MVKSCTRALPVVSDHNLSTARARTSDVIDPGLELFQYQNKATGVTRIMSAEEASALPDSESWQQRQPVQDANEPVKLSGERALELGLAWQNVDSFDQLKQLYGIDEDPVVVQPNWALELVEALASPEFTILLLMA